MTRKGIWKWTKGLRKAASSLNCLVSPASTLKPPKRGNKSTECLLDDEHSTTASLPVPEHQQLIGSQEDFFDSDYSSVEGSPPTRNQLIMSQSQDEIFAVAGPSSEQQYRPDRLHNAEEIESMCNDEADPSMNSPIQHKSVSCSEIHHRVEIYCSNGGPRITKTEIYRSQQSVQNTSLVAPYGDRNPNNPLSELVHATSHPDTWQADMWRVSDKLYVVGVDGENQILLELKSPNHPEPEDPDQISIPGPLFRANLYPCHDGMFIGPNNSLLRKLTPPQPTSNLLDLQQPILPCHARPSKLNIQHTSLTNLHLFSHEPAWGSNKLLNKTKLTMAAPAITGASSQHALPRPDRPLYSHQGSHDYKYEYLQGHTAPPDVASPPPQDGDSLDKSMKSNNENFLSQDSLDHNTASVQKETDEKIMPLDTAEFSSTPRTTALHGDKTNQSPSQPPRKREDLPSNFREVIKKIMASHMEPLAGLIPYKPKTMMKIYADCQDVSHREMEIKNALSTSWSFVIKPVHLCPRIVRCGTEFRSVGDGQFKVVLSKNDGRGRFDTLNSTRLSLVLQSKDVFRKRGLRNNCSFYALTVHHLLEPKFFTAEAGNFHFKDVEDLHSNLEHDLRQPIQRRFFAFINQLMSESKLRIHLQQSTVEETHTIEVTKVCCGDYSTQRVELGDNHPMFIDALLLELNGGDMLKLLNSETNYYLLNSMRFQDQLNTLGGITDLDSVEKVEAFYQSDKSMMHYSLDHNRMFIIPDHYRPWIETDGDKCAIWALSPTGTFHRGFSGGLLCDSQNNGLATNHGCLDEDMEGIPLRFYIFGSLSFQLQFLQNKTIQDDFEKGSLNPVMNTHQSPYQCEHPSMDCLSLSAMNNDQDDSGLSPSEPSGLT